MRVVRLVLALGLMIACRVCAAAVYVDAGSPGPRHDGRTWKTAYVSINDAMSKSRSGDIWVKSGIYREKISMGKYRNLYGGFVGTEKTTAQRPVNAPPTVINAAFEGRAVDVPVGGRCILDGLVIVNGVADRGAGVRCQTNSIVTIRNCRIHSCRAQEMGGGVYFATYTQGEVKGCIISKNAAPFGAGAVVEYHSYPVFSRSVLVDNAASVSGGGVYCPFHSGARLENCTLAYNTAQETGGAVYAYQGGPVALVASIVAYNAAPLGGGVFGGGTSSATTLTRCCFWSNEGGDWAGAIRTPSPVARNIFADPLFTNSLQLQPGSPCKGLGAYP